MIEKIKNTSIYEKIFLLGLAIFLLSLAFAVFVAGYKEINDIPYTNFGKTEGKCCCND